MDGAEKYEVETKEVGVSGSLETIEVTGTGKSFIVDAGSRHSFRVRAYGDGDTLFAVWGSWSDTETVTTESPPTMSISVRSSSPSTVTEGTSALFTLTARLAPSFPIPIQIDATQEGNFLAPNPTSTVTLRRNSRIASVSISTTNDPTCEDDGSVTATIEEQDDDEYYTYNIRASASSDDVAIRDNDCTVEFSADEYEVTEGSDDDITVELNGRLNKSLTIPIEISGTGTYTVSGLSSGNLTISSGSDRASFTISAGNDTNCTDETLDLSFGDLTDGISEGSESTAEVTLEDNDNCPPELTNPIRRVTYAENGTGEVADYDATDPDADDDLTFSISGGDDSNRFNISLRTGSLTFRNPPNFETPIDRNGDNVYEIEVSVTDDGRPNRSDSVDVEVGVTNRSPTITSGDPRVSYAEGETVPVVGYSASDPGGGAIMWSLSGADQGVFGISSGVLTFDNPPDYENPVDSNTDNVYQVTVRASDGSLTASRNVTVTVTNRSPTFTSGDPSVSYAEGGTDPVDDYSASDPGGGAIAWSLSGADQGYFDISSDGELSFKNPPDFENPADSNSDNKYLVTVTASDGRLTASRNVTVTVTDLNDPPVISGDDGVDYDENGTDAVETYSATDQDGDTITWSLPNTNFETDREDFTVTDDGKLKFNNSPDYENPHDSNRDNVYKVTVRASDGSRSRSIDVTITVEDVSELPAPTGLMAEDMIGGRGIALEWNPVTGADGYEVEVSPMESLQQIKYSGKTAEIIALAPGTRFTFKVSACKTQGTSCLSSPLSASVSRIAPMPTSPGHQEDHTVAYEDDIPNVLAHPTGIPNPVTVIRDSISRAVNAWNDATRLNIPAKNLQICEVNACGTGTNHDGGIIRIQTAGETSTGQNISCSWSTACTRDSPFPRRSEHIAGIDLIFEEPAWECGRFDKNTNTCLGLHLRIYWTHVAGYDRTEAKDPAGNVIGEYRYVDPIMMHEFGHTFGLPDFYLDNMTNLMGRPAVMDDPYTHRMPTAEDIAQLRAIYAIHEPTNHDAPGP